MENWNVDENQMKKNPVRYKLWRVSQLINYGLGQERLNLKYLRDNWKKLSTRIDSSKKAALEFMIFRK